MTHPWSPPTAAMSRRTLLRQAGAGLGLLAVPGLLSACGGDEDTASTTGGAGGGQTANAKVSDQLGWLKLSQFDGFFAAQEKGYYREEGLEVDVKAGGPNIIASQIVGSGGATVGNDDNGTVLDAIAKGQPLVIYGTIFQKSPYSVMSRPEKPVKTLEDFAGKTVALTPATRPQLDPLLKAAGVDLGSIRFVPAGPDPTQLVKGQADAYFGYATAQGVALEEQGIEIVTTYLNDLGLPNYGNVLITKRETLEQQKDLLVRHLRGSIKGWEYAIANPDEMGRLVATKYGPKGLKESTEILVNRAQAPLVKHEKGVMWIEESRMQEIIDSFEKVGGLAKPLKVEDVMTTEILEAAYGGKTSLLNA